MEDEKKTKSKKSKNRNGDKEGEKKTIMVNANDIQSLVLHSINDLMDKGVLVETEDGKKIDLKDKIESSKKSDDKEKTRNKKSKKN